MEKTLESFLHPHRSPNIKFKLPSFDGEFEMRALTVDEDLAISRDAREHEEGGAELLARYSAESLVSPNLHSADLLDELSKIKGRKILNTFDAFKEMFDAPEASAITAKYIKLSNLSTGFEEKVKEAKN